MTTLAVEPERADACDTDDDEGAQAPEASQEAHRLVAQLPVLVEALESLSDPLARARAATELMKEVEKVRVAVARTRQAAVAECGLSTRSLADCLGLSLGAAADLRRAASGGSRRRTR